MLALAASRAYGEALGLSARSRDDDTLDIVASPKFEDEDAAGDAKETIESFMELLI